MAQNALAALLAHHLVDRIDRAADGAQRGLEAARRHRGVGVDPHQTFVRALRRAISLDEFARMAERDVVDARPRRLYARQRLESFVLERPVDRAQPVRAAPDGRLA